MSAASRKDVVEAEKLRQEIKSLRQQRLLAVVTLLGATVAFLLTNAEKLSALFYRDPSLTLVTDDEALRRNAKFSVQSLSDTGAIAAADTLAERRTVRLAPGPHRLAVSAFGATIYALDFTVERGEHRTVSVPGLANANIRVSIDNQSGPIGPGSQLELQVETSGNGYLWIFESTRKGTALLYPVGCSDACGNDISVTRGLHIPDSQQRAVFAGTVAKRETLLFLVTSRSDSDSAKQLAAPFSPGTILKASGGNLKGNWGYASLSYDIPVKP